MAVFQVQSPSHSMASRHLDLDPQGLFLHRGCSSGIHCPVISPLLRSPQEPRATQHPRANHAGVTEVGAGVTQAGAGVTQAGAMAREGRNPPPIPGNCCTLELGIWRSPSINGIKAPCPAWERHGKAPPRAIHQQRACPCSLAGAGSGRGGHCPLPNDALFQLASLKIN